MLVTECPTVTRPYPPDLIAATIALMRASLSELPEAVRPMAGILLQRYPEHARQLRIAAEDLNVALEDITLGMLAYDLAMSFGCSTMALATSDGPMIARNMDWPNERLIARASCIVPADGGWNAGFVGCVGVVSGMSRNGFAITLNAIGNQQLHAEGYPVLLFLRHLIDTAADYEDALKQLCTQPLLAGGLFMIVGKENQQRALVERTPTRTELRVPRGDEPLLVTNHYRAIPAPEMVCTRYECLARKAPLLPRDPTIPDLLAVLTHPEIRQTITAQHVFMKPNTEQIQMFVPSNLLEP